MSEKGEKFMPFARFFLEKYNLDLFYLSLEFLFQFWRFVSPMDVGIYFSNVYFIVPDLFDIGIIFYKF